jgi:hypothetical protein
MVDRKASTRDGSFIVTTITGPLAHNLMRLTELLTFFLLRSFSIMNSPLLLFPKRHTKLKRKL